MTKLSSGLVIMKKQNNHIKLDNNNDVSTKNYVVITRKIIMWQQEKVIMENYLVK